MRRQAHRAAYREVVSIELSEIVRCTDRGIWARVKSTGKLAWLSRDYTQMLPGRAVVPVWLYRKIHPAVPDTTKSW